MITRDEVLSIVNNSGLAGNMTLLAKSLIASATNTILGISKIPTDEKSDKEYDKFLLNSVGPAASSAAVDFAIRTCRGRGFFKSTSFTNNFVNNVSIVHNDDAEIEGSTNFSSVLRQFLLPRYAYLDFDNIVDPRHMIDLECGYPKFITPIMYRYMYDRDDVARRVVDIYPDESWAVNPVVYEDENEEVDTDFELSWQELCDDHNIIQYLYRLDRLSGIGHYGALLIGVDDGKELDQPIDELELLAGVKGSIAKNKRNLLYLRPFDEYLSFIHQYETDIMSPRYGLPKYYNLVFLDMTIDAAGASIGTRLNRRVHWSRVIHATDNLQSSLVFGIPRMQPVFNRLLDLRKIKGGSAEMFWKGAFPGISFEIDPRFVADDPDFDKEEFREEIKKYADGLQRYLTLVGIKANTLAPNISENPDRHVKIQMQAIASHYGIPLRIFEGSEEGRLASSQDKLTWNSRLNRRIKMHVDPYIIRNAIDRFIAIGVIEPPKLKKSKRTGRGLYFTDWGDLNTSTDEDKANLSLKWTQALSQYVASGVIHLVPPMDYFTMILGLKPKDAKRIIAQVEKSGGFAKLQKVDPSQQANPGANGTQKNNVSKGDRSGKTSDKGPKRETSDKKAEGSE
jgi:hypothetical protein